jgi:hypothetical protein
VRQLQCGLPLYQGVQDCLECHFFLGVRKDLFTQCCSIELAVGQEDPPPKSGLDLGQSAAFWACELMGNAISIDNRQAKPCELVSD